MDAHARDVVQDYFSALAASEKQRDTLVGDYVGQGHRQREVLLAKLSGVASKLC